jgi:hypothetical protein
MTTTLDGFIAGPGNELDWMLNTPDRALNDDIVALLNASDAGFLGYPVAQGMIPYWEAVAADPSASTASRDIAAAVNRLRRIIISDQPVELPWDNSELVIARTDGDLAAAVTEFKRQPGGGLGVPGGSAPRNGSPSSASSTNTCCRSTPSPSAAANRCSPRRPNCS